MSGELITGGHGGGRGEDVAWYEYSWRVGTSSLYSGSSWGVPAQTGFVHPCLNTRSRLAGILAARVRRPDFDLYASHSLFPVPLMNALWPAESAGRSSCLT